MAAIRVKIVGDRKSKRVCFMEAGKDFVDALLSLLQLPCGTILKLLSHETSEGLPSIFSLYAAVDTLDQNLLVVERDFLLDPPRSTTVQGYPLLGSSLKGDPQKFYRCSNANCTRISRVKNSNCSCGYGQRTVEQGIVDGVPTTFYRCNCYCQKISTVYNTRCSCNNGLCTMPQAEDNIPSAPSATVKQGYVKADLIYIVTNNLQIYQSTAMSAIGLINEMKIGIADVHTMQVEVSRERMLKLIERSFLAVGALHEVFGGAFRRAC